MKVMGQDGQGEDRFCKRVGGFLRIGRIELQFLKLWEWTTKLLQRIWDYKVEQHPIASAGHKLVYR